MFDEQPDGDPHGECAAEIRRLQAENKMLRETLQGIAKANPRKWEELSEPQSEFERWAKSRAQHTLVAIGEYSDGMTAEDDRRFLEMTSGLTHNAGIHRAAEGRPVE